MAKTMRERFREHHRPTETEQSEQRKTCIYALDANVLLNIYRYEGRTRADLFRVLRRLDQRVWVPFQAAREFYSRRLDVIQEQRDKYTKLARSVSGVLTVIDDGTFRKSGFLQMSELDKILRPSIQAAEKFIEERRQAHPVLVDNDPYLEELAAIVGERVGEDISVEERANEAKQAQDRIEARRPPGYQDSKKPAPERYGDVHIWFELLRLGKKVSRPVIFVSDDEKEDWWQIEQGRKLGPRPELREEMRSVAGVEFSILTPARFMETVGIDLGDSVSPSSIEDARGIAQELQLHEDAKPRSARPGRTKRPYRTLAALMLVVRRAELAVEEWLGVQNPDAKVFRIAEGPFTFAVYRGSEKTVVEVRLVHELSQVRNWGANLNDKSRAAYDNARGQSAAALIVIVGEDLNLGIALGDRLLEFDETTLPTKLSVGYLSEDREYVELLAKNYVNLDA